MGQKPIHFVPITLTAVRMPVLSDHSRSGKLTLLILVTAGAMHSAFGVLKLVCLSVATTQHLR